MPETVNQQQKKMQKARAQIQAILIDNDIDNALVVISSNDAWDGCVFGNSLSLAKAYIEGMNKKYFANEILRDILSNIITNYK